MSSLEDRLHDALHDGPAMRPSPDLFARVVESIDSDRARIRARNRLVAAWVAGLALVSTLVVVLTPRTPEGDPAMPWWVLEIATTLLLVAIALWLGPFIKRFGRAYAADVFHDNPLTGKSYIVLTDIVYYLIFSAYILYTTNFAPGESWLSFDGTVNARQLTAEVARVAGILFVIGILHGLNLVLMPVLGRLFSLNRRLPSPMVPVEPQARRRSADDDLG